MARMVVRQEMLLVSRRSWLAMYMEIGYGGVGVGCNGCSSGFCPFCGSLLSVARCLLLLVALSCFWLLACLSTIYDTSTSRELSLFDQ
jgi:hypothetical protein